LKFRVWSDEAKQWLDHCAVIDCAGKVFSHYVEVDEAAGTVKQHVATIERLRPVVEQWTGLKDREGRDVYEGDLLQTPLNYTRYYEDKDPEDLEGHHLWEVVWFSGTVGVNGDEYADIRTGFAAKLVASSNPDEPLGGVEGIAPCYTFRNYGGNGGCQTDHATVVGNVHENPDPLSLPAPSPQSPT